jgi:hypothetical protein
VKNTHSGTRPATAIRILLVELKASNSAGRVRNGRVGEADVVGGDQQPDRHEDGDEGDLPNSEAVTGGWASGVAIRSR